MRSHTGDDLVRPIGGPFGRDEASPVVGTWVWTAETGCYVLDRGAAEILTGNPDLAGAQLAPDTVTRRLHPMDRCVFHADIGRPEGRGGPVVAEYRVQTPAGLLWLLDHGRIHRAPPGVPAHGHGVLIDVTQRKLRGFAGGEQEPGTPLERAARHALAARRAIDEDGSESLRLLIDMVLLEIGHVIARRVGEERAKGLN